MSAKLILLFKSTLIVAFGSTWPYGSSDCTDETIPTAHSCKTATNASEIVIRILRDQLSLRPLATVVGPTAGRNSTEGSVVTKLNLFNAHHKGLLKEKKGIHLFLAPFFLLALFYLTNTNESNSKRPLNQWINCQSQGATIVISLLQIVQGDCQCA